MTWQGFQYAFLHAARDAGAAAITTNNAFTTAGPKDFLIDDRAGALCIFSTAETDHYIQIDRGAGTLEEIARLIIPEGHNLDTETVRVRTDTAVDFSADPTEILVETAISGTGIIDEAMAGGTEAQRKYRYVRVDFPNAGAITPEIPELILTRTRTTDRGPEKGWDDYLVHNTQDFPLRSGAVASLSDGADRQFYGLDYRDVKLAADLLVFSDLIATCGTSKPFYVDKPFTGEDPVWVKLTEDSRQTQDEAVPAATDAPMKHIRLSMLEHLA